MRLQNDELRATQIQVVIFRRLQNDELHATQIQAVMSIRVQKDPSRATSNSSNHLDEAPE
jgi:hypothetical protein